MGWEGDIWYCFHYVSHQLAHLNFVCMIIYVDLILIDQLGFQN